MTGTEGVRPEQRFTREHSCPVCGGHDGDPRGQGVRCFGFVSDDGEWAHCTREELAGDAPRNEKSGAYVHKLRGDCRCGVQHGDEELVATLTPNGTRSPRSAEPEPEEVSPETRKQEVYTYHDAEGVPLFRVQRTADKRFFQKRYDRVSGGWKNGLGGVVPVLYNLPEILRRRDDPVYVVEGEKDADRLTAEGLLATTSPMGAGKWRRSYAASLEDREVYVLPDNDDVGEAHAATVAESVDGAVVVWLPGLPLKGDVSDWLDAGNTIDGLQEIARATPRSVEVRFSSDAEPITAAELMAREFAPTRWVVPDVLPEGVTLLAGKPKKGKSWLALGLCEAVAAGSVAFGTKHVDQGCTLYLALEDHERRLQKRLRKVLDGRKAPARMHVHTEWQRLNEGGAERLDRWLTAHPDARLVVVDTLAKIRKPTSGANVYAEDYAALEYLLPLAARHGVAIVVVHHLRKEAAADPMDEISSSTGLTGGVDGFLILRRAPGSKGPTLFVDGRDIEEPAEYALHWNPNTATWTIEGDATEVHISKERADILLVLNRHRVPMTPREVTDAMPGAKYPNIKYLMWSMLGDDQLKKLEKGAYYPTNPTNPANPTNRANRVPDIGSVGSGSGLVQGATPANPSFGDTYEENPGPVSGVSAVSGGSGDVPDTRVPVSYDAEEGEVTTVAELQRRREQGGAA